MKFEGGCYCGMIRYVAEGEPLAKVQCHCRECQYISGGNPNVIVGMPKEGFRYTKGEPKRFSRDDIEISRTREFCPNCGTHLTTLSPGLPNGLFIKVGTMDDPSVYGKPEIAIQIADAQDFHHVPEDVTAFERWAKY